MPGLLLAAASVDPGFAAAVGPLPGLLLLLLLLLLVPVLSCHSRRPSAMHMLCCSTLLRAAEPPVSTGLLWFMWIKVTSALQPVRARIHNTASGVSISLARGVDCSLSADTIQGGEIAALTSLTICPCLVSTELSSDPRCSLEIDVIACTVLLTSIKS